MSTPKIESYLQLPCKHFIKIDVIKIIGDIQNPRPCYSCGQYFFPDVVKAFYFNLPMPKSNSITERTVEHYNDCLKKINRGLVEKIKEFKVNSDEHARLCENLIEENFEIKQKNTKLMAEIKKEITKTVKEMKKREELVSELSSIKTNVAKMEKTIKKMTANEITNNTTIKELKKQLKDKTSEYINKIDTLEKEVQKLKDMLIESGETQYNLSDLNREIDRLKGINSRFKMDNQELNKKIDKMSIELSGLHLYQQQLYAINSGLYQHYIMSIGLIV
jgi:chromosome segregation ATPase